MVNDCLADATDDRTALIGGSSLERRYGMIDGDHLVARSPPPFFGQPGHDLRRPVCPDHEPRAHPYSKSKDGHPSTVRQRAERALIKHQGAVGWDRESALVQQGAGSYSRAGRPIE